ncbi:response regulator [Mongoliitalea daihaiensis]|uniref:response regulator n=1 Tax=Mongoliitalea daihaiensis TaxID=2782006 RepID=UPI001F429EAD|nr:response regulator [Mongoliitalea daihaiensis]UJP65249.1 response regulator [Mongoliitalea daihaiensis]
MKVLVVDDDAVARLILKKVFEKENHTVFTACDGIEALEILAVEKDFNVVITDIMMPNMDGLMLLSEIKKSSKMRSIPIIGFTAGNIEVYKRKSKDSFDELLPKPMDFYQLYNIAREHARD